MNSKVIICAITLTAVFYMASASEEPTCPDTDPKHPTFFEDPDDCGAFYECSNQVALHLFCPPGTYFELSRKICVWAENADCGTRPTTPESDTSSTTPESDTTLDPDISTTELEFVELEFLDY